MTEPKIGSMMKRLGKMLWDEQEGDGIGYELSERSATPLLDLGYVELIRFTLPMGSYHIDCSSYSVTEKGREEYFKWIEQQKVK